MKHIKKIIRICTIAHWCRKTFKNFKGQFEYYYVLYCSDDCTISVVFKYAGKLITIIDTSTIKSISQFTEILIEKCRRYLNEEPESIK